MRKCAFALSLIALAALAAAAGCYFPVDRYEGPSSYQPPPPQAPPSYPQPGYGPQGYGPPPAPPPVYFDHDPDEVYLLPDYGVYALPDVGLEVYFYGDRWYRRSGTNWFFSLELRGPWSWLRPDLVPAPVTRVPPDYRRYPGRYQRVPYGVWKKGGYRIGEPPAPPSPPPPLPPPPPPPYFDRDPDEVYLLPDYDVYTVPDVDFDVYFYGDRWYRRSGTDWFFSLDLRGPWSWLRVESVPSRVVQVPPDYRRHPSRYQRVPYGVWKKSGYRWAPPPPSQPPPPPRPPLVIDRDPEEAWLIPGLGVFFVPRLEADLFYLGGRWYVGGAAGWFWGPDYHGPWTAMGQNDLPDPFRRLPPDFRTPNRYQRLPFGQWKQRGFRWEEDRRDDREDDPGDHRREGRREDRGAFAPAPPVPPPPPPPSALPRGSQGREPGQVVVVPPLGIAYVPGADLVFHEGRWFHRERGIWSEAPGYQGPWKRLAPPDTPRPVLTLPPDLDRIQGKPYSYGDWVKRGMPTREEVNPVKPTRRPFKDRGN